MFKLIAVNQLSQKDARDKAAKTLFSVTDSCNFDFKKAKTITQTRLSNSKHTLKTARLKRRLKNLDQLENWITSKKNATLVGVCGWGEGASFAEKRMKISQYDTFYVRVNGKLQAYQLDSSFEVQQWGDAFTQSSTTGIESHALKYTVGQLSKKLSKKFNYSGKTYTKNTEAPIQLQKAPKPVFQTTKNILQVKETHHKDHTHFSLISTTSRPSYGDHNISNSDEGCPCCTAGLDFDEFAAAVNETLNSSTTESGSSIQSLADVGSAQHLGFALGIASPFAVLGLTAAVRNIKGCWNNRKKLNQVLKAVREAIKESEINGETAQVRQLKAFKKSIKYSKFDTDFNLIIPGVVNGSASALVLSTILWHQPFALPVIGAYATAQFARNSIDLVRVWNHKIKPDHNHDLKHDYLNRIGIDKINQIGESKRKFYLSNALGFAAFATGSIITFASVLTLPLFGLGAVGLPVGIALLSLGAGSTGMMNNLWPRKFKPRNGDLGISRKTLDSDRIRHEIGKRKSMKSVLKNIRQKHCRQNKTKQFFYHVLSALPWGDKYAQKLRHKDNLNAFKQSKESLKQNRTDALQGLLYSQDSPNEVKDTVASQWTACQELGLEADILNTLLKDSNPQATPSTSGTQCCNHPHLNPAHHFSYMPLHTQDDQNFCYEINSSDYTPLINPSQSSSTCCGEGPHDKYDYLSQLRASGFVDVRGDSVQLKPFDTLTKAQRVQLGEAIDYYLYFELIEKLRYEQYGLNDYYWHYQRIK